uniref:DDE Tnp4 domain-containing protein n=1 Tax=Timema monikensis TaxID=170555 RepID=A0A7R9ECK5_9NEOP|nr:unnamed protein product [Timema monikensis]
MVIVSESILSWKQMCGDLCGISQPTACGAIHTITEVFAGRLRDHIRLPSTHQEAIDAMTWFFDYGGFPGVVAAVDGTHILIANPGGNSSEVYRNVFSINVQVAAGINLKIVDIVARRPGSFNDATIFEGSGLHMAFEEGRIEGHLLGDSEYPCLPFLFTPLPPQNARTEPEIRYNLHHEKSLNAAKHLFGLWKRRFRCLKSGLEYKPYFVVAIICATAVLYNISREVNEPMPDDEFPWVEEVHQPLSPSPDHANRVDHHFREDFISCLSLAVMLNPPVRTYRITSPLEVLLDKKQLFSVQADAVKRDYLDFVLKQEVIDYLK